MKQAIQTILIFAFFTAILALCLTCLASLVHFGVMAGLNLWVVLFAPFAYAFAKLSYNFITLIHEEWLLLDL